MWFQENIIEAFIQLQILALTKSLKILTHKRYLTNCSLVILGTKISSLKDEA